MDRASWSSGFVFCAQGLRIGVRCTDPSVLERLASALPPGARSTAGDTVDHLYSVSVGRDGARYHALYVGVVRLARSLVFDEMVAAFDADLQIRLAEFARGRVFVHAGVVGWQGRALVFPGHSFAGKSTLVAALVRAGADYYSDEYAVLDAKGRVHPYARPLALRSSDTGDARQVPVEELGGRSGTQPLRVARVVLARYRAGARWRPRSCSPGQAVMSLLAHTIPARRKPAAVLSALRAMLADATVVQGARGEADDFARRLLEPQPQRAGPAPLRDASSDACCQPAGRRARLFKIAESHDG